MTSLKLNGHQHPLFYLDTAKLFATKHLPCWTCDACKRTSKEMQVTHSFRCMSCDIDICKECSEPIMTKTHSHKMVTTDANGVYPNGAWACDNCTTDARSQGPVSWHCENGCNFDLCFGCTRNHKSLAHPHPLVKGNPEVTYPENPGWKCDICQTNIRHTAQEKPYQCKECKFDVCLECLKNTYEVQPKIVEVQKSLGPDCARMSVTNGSDGTDGEPAASVFISYNWNIQDKVLDLKRKLESMNIKCWMDTGNMVGGDDLKKEIDKGMRGSKIVISCVTKAYSQSNACQQEVALADVLKKPILPVLFEHITWPPEGPMAMPFAPLIYVSLEDGLTSENVEKVVKTIKSKAK